jgi:hypothetical protein
VSGVIPPEVAAQLDHTDGGLPIFVSTSATLPAGTTIGLAYDATLDDPITRWGQCLSRVVACHAANPGAGPIAPCIALIERCADNHGGKGCCPSACLDRYAMAVASGEAESDAFTQIFLDGSCVDGMAALLAQVADGGAP